MLYGYVTLSARPAFTFTGVFTQNPQSRAGTGSAFADFLLGEVNQLTDFHSAQELGKPPTHLRKVMFKTTGKSVPS